VRCEHRRAFRLAGDGADDQGAFRGGPLVSESLRVAALQADADTLEEAEDFDVGDDPELMRSPHEIEGQPTLKDLLAAGAIAAKNKPKPPEVPPVPKEKPPVPPTDGPAPPKDPDQ